LLPANGLVASRSRDFPAVFAIGDGAERHIVEGLGIAGGVSERQVLDIGAERVADRRLHRVGARIERFRHHVADVVDDVGVVADAADHRVGTHAAAEGIVAGAAGERVGAGIAGERIVAGAAGDVLEPGRRCEPGRSAGGEIDRHRACRAGIVERVGATAGIDFEQLDSGRGHALDRADDAGAVDDRVDGVVAGRSRHEQRVGAGAAVDGVDAVADGVEDRVIAAAGMNDVVAAPGQEQVDAVGAGDVVDSGRAAEHRSKRLAVERKQRMARGDVDRMSFDTVTCGGRRCRAPARSPRRRVEESGLARDSGRVALEGSSAVGSIASAQPQPAWPEKLVAGALEVQPSRSV
jgi:hypothetical protein